MKEFLSGVGDASKPNTLLHIVDLRKILRHQLGEKVLLNNIILLRRMLIITGVFSEVVVLEPQDLGTPPSVVSIGEVVKATHIEPLVASPGESTSAVHPSSFSNKSLSLQSSHEDNPKCKVVGFHHHENIKKVWHSMAAQVEEGWITVKGKKKKSSRPSFDMTLHSHKKSANCKS